MRQVNRKLKYLSITQSLDLAVRKILNLGDVEPPRARQQQSVVAGQISKPAEAQAQFRQLLNARALIPTLGATKAEVKQALHEALQPAMKQREHTPGAHVILDSICAYV